MLNIKHSYIRVRATRGYATPATGPPPLALENNLTDTENKTHHKKKKQRSGQFN